MPCPIRDHYQFAHSTIKRFNTLPMDDDAAKALADPDYRERMINYDEHLKTLLDPMWDKRMQI